MVWDVSTLKSEYYLVQCIDDKVDTHNYSYIRINCFWPDPTEEEVWPGETLPMLLPESSAFNQILGLRFQGFVWPKYHFLACITERGVAL